MTVAATQAYPHRANRSVSFTHVFKSAFELAFLAVCGFEAGAPVLGYASTDSIGKAWRLLRFSSARPLWPVEVMSYFDLVASLPIA